MLTDEMAILTAEPALAEKSDVQDRKIRHPGDLCLRQGHPSRRPPSPKPKSAAWSPPSSAPGQLGHTVSHADQKKEAEQKENGMS